mgnify:CR=1 FL=1
MSISSVIVIVYSDSLILNEINYEPCDLFFRRIGRIEFLPEERAGPKPEGLRAEGIMR